MTAMPFHLQGAAPARSPAAAPAGAFHPDTLGTLCGLFRARVAATPERIAYRQYDEATETWVSHTWAQVAAAVARWQAALAKEGLAPGERVAVMLKNCVEWVIFDQAALRLGLVTVPLYLDDRPDNAAYILNHAGARLLLAEGKFQYRKLAEIANSVDSLQRIVCLSAPDNDACQQSPRFVRASEWLDAAAGTPLPEPQPDADALASIVYTSGTTGRPKGVMLTHANILWNAWYTSHCGAFDEQDVFLSFLPLSHSFERTEGYYLPVMLGAEVAYARSIALLAQDLLSIRPSVLISVPRIYERVYARIQENLKKKGRLAQTLFDWTVRTGWRRFEVAQKRAAWHPMLLAWPLLDAWIARPVAARLGGRLKFAVSGGAPLNPGIGRCFIALGVPLYQGYGLTEASPTICVNRPQSNIPASIGQPLPGVEMRLGEKGELLTRSRCVTRGYWQNEEATRAMIDAEGWLHTGDQATQDAWGHYHITGRIKDIIVLNNGEKVPPGDMESAILLDPLFEQVMVVGEGRPYLAALTVLNEAQWQAFAAGLEIDPAHPTALRDPRVMKALIQRIASQLGHFPGYAQIRRLHPELTPWTVDEGLLTPTLKLKRNQVLDRYHAAIEALYADFAR